jgi:vitamin B12 transporter
MTRPQPHRRSAAGLAAAALLLGRGLAAQSPAPGPVQAQFQDTATVVAQPLGSATATETVLERQEIERSGARTVTELLRLVPGVDISTNGGRGGLTTAQIRGSKPSFTRVLIDGIPVNDPTYQVGDVFDLAGMPASMVERIEVVRGPLSSFYGSTGLAGVINIVTRRGQRGAPAAEIAAAGGNASFGEAQGMVSGGLGGGSYALASSWEEESRRVARDSFRQLDLLGNLSQPLQPNTQLRLTSRYTIWHSDDYPDASGGPLFGSGELRQSEHREASLGGELIAGGGEHPSTWTASVYRHDLDRTSPAVPPEVPASTEATAYTELRAGGAVTLFAGTHFHWSAGADVSHERGENRSALDVALPGGGEVQVPGSYDLARTLAGAYSELLFTRGRLGLDLEGRLDHFDGLPPQGAHLEASPRLGASLRLDDATRLHASVGRAFQLPSFFALASPPQLGGNPNLRPETTVGGDAGIEHTLAALPLKVAVTLFYNRFHGLIDFDFTRFQNVNRSEVAAQGAELSFVWRAAAHLRLAANATCQEVTDLTTRESLLHQPRWVGGGSVDWQPAAAWSVFLDLQAVARTLDQELPVPDRDMVPGYGLLGLASSWQFAREWQLRGRIDNLGDRGYQALVGFPGPRRELRLGVSYSPRLR